MNYVTQPLGSSRNFNKKTWGSEVPAKHFVKTAAL